MTSNTKMLSARHTERLGCLLITAERGWGPAVVKAYWDGRYLWTCRSPTETDETPWSAREEGTRGMAPP